MAATRKSKEGISDRAGLLAQRLSEGLVEGRVVPRFVDSYVVERGRYALQVHPGQYRDLLTMLQREALLAISAQALEMASKGTAAKEDRRFSPMTHKDAASFRQKFLAALGRHQHWNVGAALEFQTDLQMYESILARAQPGRRSRKPFEAANHPFVDRCAFLLDSSFMEDARLAASRALANLEALTTQLTAEVFCGKP
ncbi:MAG TPA: hypothetical protein VMU53_19735 [Candidatus Sulfotelmatobacter sp.]|nr:hypothetical protein [Candidatus Sulfotelmatobacter sp.]